jgi:type II secretory pathway component PulM
MTMFSFLAQYSLREKAIVAGALVVVIVLGVHALVIEPYQERVALLRETIEQQNTDLVWMKSAVAGLPVAGAANPAADQAISGTLANFIDQVVRRQGLSEQLSQISPIGNDEIRMRYNSVDFNRLVSFIAQVNTSGLEIKNIRILPADIAGIVDSNIVLVRR